MTIGDALNEIRVTPPDTRAIDAKLERALDLCDDLEAIFPGSYVEVVIHAPGATYRNRDLTDNSRLYSLRIKAKS